MKEGRSQVLGSPSAQVEAPARVCYNFYIEVSLGAPLAQLDRASGYEPEGREFESLRARHFNPFLSLQYAIFRIGLSVFQGLTFTSL